jgi:hypothetical protein
MPLLMQGLIIMDEILEQPTQDIDMNLALKIIKDVPYDTWPAVYEATVSNIVDELSIETMFQMCELYLRDYYMQNPMEMIPDLMRIKGEESALYILETIKTSQEGYDRG